MNFHQPPKRALRIALAASLGLISTNTFATEFADDFSSDSIRFSTDTLRDSSGIYSVTPASNGLSLTTTTPNASATGSLIFSIQNDTDDIGMDVSHLSTSSIDDGVRVSAFLETRLYSEKPDSTRENPAGTIEAEIIFSYDQNRTPFAFHCLRREDSSGFQTELPEACSPFEGVAFAMDEKASFDIKLDRDASQVIFTANGVSKSIDITSEIYPPAYQFDRIQLYSDGGAATTETTLHAVRLGDETIDMAVTPPVVDRYSTNFDRGTTVTRVNEKLTITTVSVAEDDRWTQAELYIQQPTDYLEAELTLASSSDLSGAAYRARAEIAGTFYNTEADSSINDRLGDVSAYLILDARGDGLRRIELCLYRDDDIDAETYTGLLDSDDPDRRCDYIPMLLELDTPYRVALGLNRDEASFIVKVNGYTRAIPINSEIFPSANSFARVSISSRNNSIANGTIDNIRTAPDSLTASEQTAGLSIPGAFPDPIDPDSLVVDSTVAHPFDFSDTQTQLDFVDDFSGITSDFGFWSGRDRGESGVSWDGTAVVFETNTAAGNDDGNYTEFYLDPRTDSLEANVSLSSATRLPADGSAEIAVRAIFYNDTQDYGFNDQEGDMEAQIALEVEGDGRRRVKARLRRRDAGGSSTDDLLNDVAAFDDGLNSTVPALDQTYKISLSIDRDNGVIRFGLDDEITEFQIPTGVFLPSRRRALISVNHNGSSGLAVGKIHSVKTDTIDEDFSLAAPVIAPYRPTFNAQHPGRLVEAVDGRLRLEADGTLSSGRDPRIIALNGSDYVGATIELSSESDVQPDGEVFIGVSGTMYNDLSDGVTEESGQEGNVFVALRMTAEGNGERYVQTCAWRSNDSDFDDATDLLSGSNETCARFPNAVPDLDTAYPAFIKLDRIAATLTFGFNGETFIYNISTSINPTQPFHGVRARTSDGSKVVAWADDLSFAENPVALADSTNVLTVDTSASGDTDGNEGNGDSGTSDNTSDSGSSSGGGSFSPGVLLLGLLVLIRSGPGRRRSLTITQKPQRIRHLLTLCLCAGLLQGCAATLPSANSDASLFLDQEAITAHVSGKTETWSKGAGYYANNGDLAIVWDGELSSGNWHVTDKHEMCLTAEVWGADEECHRYQLIKGDVHLFYNNKAVKRETVDGNQLDLFM